MFLSKSEGLVTGYHTFQHSMNIISVLTPVYLCIPDEGSWQAKGCIMVSRQDRSFTPIAKDLTRGMCRAEFHTKNTHISPCVYVYVTIAFAMLY